MKTSPVDLVKLAAKCGLCRHVAGCFLKISVLSMALCSQALSIEFLHRGRVLEIEDLTHDVKRIRLQILDPEEFVFKPGQYVFLRVPPKFVHEWNLRYKTNHREIFRPYSFASSPSRLPTFDFIIKHFLAPPRKSVPPGIASTYLHTRLRPGDVIHLSEPTGTLYLGQDSSRSIVMVAGGSGIAPFVGLLEYWFEQGVDQNRKIHLFLGARCRRDLLLHKKFSIWAVQKRNFTYTPALSSPRKEDDWCGETGFIQLSVDKHVVAPSEAEAYLAGPPLMVKMVVEVLKDKGISDNRIFYDQILARE